jgi:hypothetical protein
LEDSKQQSSESDIKGTMQLKYDDIEKTPFEDSKLVEEEKSSLPAVDKDEPKATFETESKNKTENAEDPEVPNIDFSAGKAKNDGTGKMHDLQEKKGNEFTEGVSDEKETAAHVITKQDANVQDRDKLSATAEAVSKSDGVENEKTVKDTEVLEQLPENLVNVDTEKGKVERSLEEGTESSKLVHKEGIQEVVKQEILDKSKETSKPALETERKSISHQEEKTESVAETSRGEGQMFDSTDEIKHITEKFIEKEICAVKVEASEANKQQDQPGFYETTKRQSDKHELETIAGEKTDVGKPVLEESEEEKVLEDLAGEISEAETCELKDMDLKERGKELESLEKEALKTEQMKYSEEKGESDKVFLGASKAEKVHDHEKDLIPDITSEEAAIQTKPVQGKIDVQKAQFEEDDDFEKLDEDKSVIIESRSEKVEDFITKTEKLSKDDSGTESSDHPELEKHDVAREPDIHTQSLELKQTAGALEADIMKPEKADVGSIEPKTKDIMAVKEIILTKDGSAVDVEKESKDLSSKSDDNEEDKTDISRLNMNATECIYAEVPTLATKEDLADKPSPGALSLTYLEIIDKLQKDSQKTDDSTIATAKESSLLTESKQYVSEGQPKEDPFTDQVLDTLSKNENKIDEKSKMDITESVTEAHSSQISDTEGIDSVQTTTEIIYNETVGDSNNAITKSDEVDSGESAGEEPLITTRQLKDLQDATEFVPVISKEHDMETKTESEYEKTCDKDIIETKSDQVSIVCKVKEPVTTGLSQQTDEDSKYSIKGDTQKIVDSKTLEEVEESKLNVGETDMQGEMKLTDDKDDSYGDGSISPDEAYVDSGLEEEPVYRKLEAAEHPEFVTVTPDSAPQSPKSQRDKKSSVKTEEEVLEHKSLAAVKTAFEHTEVGSLQEDTQKKDNITIGAGSEKAKHESQNDDLLIADKCGSTADFKERTTDLVAGTPKKEAEATAATADMPRQISVPEGQHDISITISSDQPTELLSRSDLKMRELGEANVLEDLVSASKSAIAEIEGKLSTQIEEILTAPRKESNQIKSEIQESKSEIQESKPEIASDTTDKILSSVDKDLTATSQVLHEEVTRASEDEEEVKLSPKHPTETDETVLKSNEEVEHESHSVLTGKASEKSMGGSDRKQGPTEDTSATELGSMEGVLTSHTADMSVTQIKICLDHDVEKNTLLREITTPSTPASVISKEVPLSVTSEADISKTTKQEVTDSTTVDQSTVPTTKETTVVKVISSSHPASMTTSSVSDITIVQGTAERKTDETIASSTITVSDGADRDEAISCPGNLTSSVSVCRMVMTASSEDGGTETEVCSSRTITAPTTSSTEPTTLEHKQEVPEKQCTELTLSETSKHVIEEDTGKGTEDNSSKGHISETRAANGDMYTGNGSTTDGEGRSKLVTRTIKELTEADEIEFDDRDNMEEFTTQEIGDDGKIITRTVKTARNVITAEGEESDDSDFEDEDNIESTAAEDGSDSSRMSKITSSLTTVIKKDDNGVSSLPTDTTDKTAGDVDSEVVIKATTTTITTLSSDEPGEVVTKTTTKEIILGDGSTPHDTTKDVDVLCEKEEVSQLDFTESSKPADVSKCSSPLKVTTTDITHYVQAQTDPVTSGVSVAGATEKEGKLTEAAGSKEEEQKVVNGKGSETESVMATSTTEVGKTLLEGLEEPSFASVKNEAQTSSSELIRCATPGSDVVSDSDLDAGCGPLALHSSISSCMTSRETKNMTGSCEGHPDSRHCDSDEEDDDDEPGSPLSVTSQLPPSPPSNFYFEMSDRVIPDYETKHFVTTSTKYKEVPFSMTSSLYESFPPETFHESVKEQRDTRAHFLSSSIDETPVKYSGTVLSEDSIMTSSFYGSLDTDKKTTALQNLDNSEKRQEDETLDFERAKYEHRAARGKDLTSSDSSYNTENTSSPTHATKKYEYQYMSGINGQKLKDDNSFQELTQDYGNANIAAGKQYEDLMNQNRDTKEMEYQGNIAARFSDQSGSGSHPKQTEHISADILEGKKETLSGASGTGAEHDPMLHHQFSTPTTSASFPEPPQGFAQSSGVKEDNKKDPIADWGKPLGLPAPTPPPTNNSNIAGEDLPNTPKREKKVMQIKKTMNESNKTASGKDSKLKRPDSPMKRPISEKKVSSNKEGGKNVGGGKSSGSPIYINLTYVPHHGNSYYTTLEFFKKVRARYYVFSGTEPSREVYNALLDAKQTWEDKELGKRICSSK